MSFWGRLVQLAVVVGMIGISWAGSARASTVGDDLVNELYVMKSVYSAEYAPREWKKAYANYDLETSFATALQQAQANPNLTRKQARDILKAFVYAMKDYHTSLSFVSTEKASLPFTIKGAGSKFFIMYIDRGKLPLASFPFNVGDELATFDGKPAAEAVAEVQAQFPANVPGTDQALAELRLTFRTAARGLDVPEGPVSIGVRKAGSSSVTEFQMAWEYTPEGVKVAGNPPSTLLNAEEILSKPAPVLFQHKMTADVVDALPSSEDDANPYDIGVRKTFTPDLGAKIWQSADTDFFYAYLYKAADGKLVGYLRLPSYEASDYGKAVAEFDRDITLFESATDALVIDQANNPGGSIFYLYALASMLATQPLHTPLHRMSITPGDVAQALKTIDQLQGVKTDSDAKKALSMDDANGYPISYEFAQFGLSNARFIVSEWNAGRRLTNPYWIDGVDHINPAADHYTKPILLLTNQLDFSGGDFFPATLQDNKRVTILGARTAGAGGYVNDITVPNDAGVDIFRCTESIAERITQNPIENLGVTPDIPYSLTEQDLQRNYVGYVKAIQTAVSALTGTPAALR